MRPPGQEEASSARANSACDRSAYYRPRPDQRPMYLSGSVRRSATV